MADDVSQNLDISISADGESAVSGFQAVDDAAKRIADGVEVGNKRIADSAAAVQAKLIEVAASSSKPVEELHQRFADSSRLIAESIDESGASVVRTAGERARQMYQDAKRELRAIRDDMRAGVSTPEEAIASTRAVQASATLRPGAAPYSRAQLQEGSLAGDQDLTARYRLYVESERQLQAAQNEATASTRRSEAEQTQAVTDGVRARVQAMNDETRLGTLTREERKANLDRMLQDVKGNADAEAIILRESNRTTIQLNQERVKSEKEKHGAIADAALNAGYLLPGGVGNALTNLGYVGQGGPASLAVGGAAIAAIGIGTGLGGAAEIASKDQEALDRLGVAVKNNGGNWTELSKTVEEWAALQERTTAISRSQTIPALLELANAGVSVADATKIVRVAEDASVATGKPLADITHELLNAYNGNARGLIQLGVVTRDQIREGMSFTDVLRAIEKDMGNQATTVDSYGRKQQQLKTDFEGIARTIGDALLPKLGEAADGLDHVVRSIDAVGIASGVKGAANGVSDLAGAFGHLGQALAPIVGLYEKIASLDVSVNKAILGGVTAAVSRIPQLGTGDSGAEYTSGLPSGPGSAGAIGTPALPSVDIKSAIDNAAAQYASTAGVPPATLAAILYAVDGQESGHGRSSNYNAATGRDRDGNQGRGRFQLDPASGASAAELDKVSTDVGEAARKAAQMLAENLRASNGDIRTALATYNAGGPSTKGLAYADEVLRQLPGGAGPTNASLNPADVNVAGRQGVGGRPGDPFQEDMRKAQREETEERLRGLTDYRQTYESTLQSIISKYREVASAAAEGSPQQIKALDDVGKAEAALAAAQAKDAAEAKRAQTEAERQQRAVQKAIEDAMRAEEARDDLARRRSGNTQAAYTTEISALTRLRDERAAANDVDSTRDVDTLNAKIQSLVDASRRAWATALSDAEKHYKQTSESLDAYLAKLKDLERGTGTEQKRELDARATAAIQAETTKFIKDLNDTITQAAENGASRPQLEALTNDALRQMRARSNRGDSTVADANTAELAKLNREDRGYDTQDARDALTALDQKYKELNTDIADGIKLTSDANVSAIAAAQQHQHDLDAPAARDRQQLAAIEAQIAALHQLQTQYIGNADAVKVFQDKIDQLGVTEHDTNDKMLQDERAALRTRTQDYQQFADSATSNMAKIWTSGQTAMQDFHTIFKTTIADLEQQLLKSAFAQVFFKGAGSGDLSVTDALQRSIFGGVAPPPPNAAANATQQQIAQHLARTATGQPSDPVHVRVLNPSGGESSGGGSGLSSVVPQLASDALSGGLLGAFVGGAGAAQITSAVASKTYSVSTSFNGGPSSGWGGTQDALTGAIVGPNVSAAIDALGNYSPTNGGQPYPTLNVGSSGGGGGAGPFGLFTGGAAKTFNTVLQGVGYGATAAQLTGGNQTYGSIGGALGGVAALVTGANPIAGAALELGAGLIGGLFGPHWGPASNYPDRSDTQRYGQIMADLYGTNQANGSQFTKDQQTAALFFPGTTQGAGAAGVERLLAGGQAAFVAQTGLTAADYTKDLAMFGADPNALGTGGLYTPTSNVGVLASHAKGATGKYSYTDYGAALAAIEQGLQGTGGASLGPWNTYSVRRSLPDYNLALQTGGQAVQQALQAGSGTTVAAGKTGTVTATQGGEPHVVVNAPNSTFVGADGISGLTDLIQQALARKNNGTLPNPNARRTLNV